MRDTARHSGSGPAQGKPLKLSWFTVIAYVEGASWVNVYIAAHSRKRAAEIVAGEERLQRCGKLVPIVWKSSVPDEIRREPQVIHYRKLRFAIGQKGPVEEQEVATL